MNKPNVLIILVDEMRYPTIYESKELKKFRKQELVSQQRLIKKGLSFNRHYAASTACSPSRASIYTGQYPSLHGVSQTAGAAKGNFDEGMYWLDPTTLPTMGHIFKKIGYDTYWNGKWHASESNLLIPGTHQNINTYKDNGDTDPEKVKLYKKSNVLEDYGFSNWVGPDPHGSSPLNTGDSANNAKGRDQYYATQTIELLHNLENCRKNNKPWLCVSSFVNPHDISLFGLQTNLDKNFDFSVNNNVPIKLFNELFQVTKNENLDTNNKPTCQAEYQKAYNSWFPIINSQDELQYYKVYYNLHKKVDIQIGKVLDALEKSKFYDNTIVLFTSDHGDLLGSHGYSHQKWYNLYDESLRVPFIISWANKIKPNTQTDLLTSHVDIIPTLLGLINVNPKKIIDSLKSNFLDTRYLVGNDVSKHILFNNCSNCFNRLSKPIYFMTDDDPVRGINFVDDNNFYGLTPYSVNQPTHISAVIVKINNNIWKYACYFDNKQFWSKSTNNPPIDEYIKITNIIDPPITKCKKITKLKATSKQYEMYNVTEDPLEQNNLVYSEKYTYIRKKLEKLLFLECKKKRLYPIKSGQPAQRPKCNDK